MVITMYTKRNNRTDQDFMRIAAASCVFAAVALLTIANEEFVSLVISRSFLLIPLAAIWYTVTRVHAMALLERRGKPIVLASSA